MQTRPESSLFSRSAVLLHALLWQAWIKTSSCCYLTFWTTMWWGRSALMTSASRCASWSTRSPQHSQQPQPIHVLLPVCRKHQGLGISCRHGQKGVTFILWTRAPSGIPCILSKQEISARDLFLNLSAPKQNRLEKDFVHQHWGNCRSAAGCRWWCDCVMSFKPQSFSLTSRKKNLRYSKTNIPGNEVKLEKLQSRQRLWKCPCI